MRPAGGCAGCEAGQPASPREAAHPGLESGGPPDGLPGARSPKPGPAPLGGTWGAAGRPPGTGPKPAHAGEPAAGGRRGRPGGERSQPGGEAARVRAAARGLPASFPPASAPLLCPRRALGTRRGGGSRRAQGTGQSGAAQGARSGDRGAPGAAPPRCLRLAPRIEAGRCPSGGGAELPGHPPLCRKYPKTANLSLLWSTGNKS